MQFMLIVNASKHSEAGSRPSPELIEAMSEFNEKLRDAGVQMMAKGLHPSSNGMRLSYEKPGEEPVVSTGPFTDSISGFILIDVNSREEAVEWAKRMPDLIGYGEGQVELRQIYEGEVQTEIPETSYD